MVKSSTTPVVITGIGMVSPLGFGVEENWQGLLNSRYPFAPMRRENAAALGIPLVGEVDDAGVKARLTEFKDWRRVDRQVPMSLLASQEALNQAGCLGPEQSALRDEMACIVGSGVGAIESAEKLLSHFLGGGRDSLPPTSVIRIMHNAPASYSSLFFGLKGTHFSVGAACASGATALLLAQQWVSAGQEDCVLVSGVDANLSLSHLSAWKNIRVLSHETDPDKACRPFDRDRPGVLISEGAASFVVESEASANRRGARILGRFLGGASTSDAHHITAPDGDSQVRCMIKALKVAGISPDAVDYLNAHGSGSDLNDQVELASIARAFEGRTRALPVSSTKGVTGHLLGAGGALEAAICLKILGEQTIPGMENLEHPLPASPLIELVRQRRAEVSVNTVISNSFAFGGNNTTLVFGRA